jgi:hypothetical protein
VACKTESHTGGGGGATVVGLHTAACHHRIGAGIKRLSKEEFKFAHLVAGELKSGHIIAFDIEFNAQFCANALKFLERRWRPGK